MDSEKWQLIKEVFEQVVDMPPDQRRRELITLTESNKELRKEVESLLEFDSQKQVICTSATPLDGNTSGAVVGPYRLNFPLAINEKTEVWQAVHETLPESSPDRRVAIKFFKDVSGDERRERRFRQEAAILARFEHPSIARFLEEGQTASGVPWFSTAYVEGMDMLTMAKRQNLGLSERLDLFDQVCAALEYSHRFLVVHRDIKPTNIIVDESGKATLIDFGISKQIAPALVDPDKLTRTFERTLTPAYASPEQLRGEPVSAVTDVYGAGLVLYELVSGHHPYSDPVHDKNRPLFDRILFELPKAPSVAKENRAEELSGLDQIVMQAISKAPDQRQQSISELRRQINDLRSGKAMPALIGAATYRTWFERNPLLAITLSAILGGLLTFWCSALMTPASSETDAQAELLEQVAVGDVNFDGLSEDAWRSSNAAIQLLLLKLAIENERLEQANSIAAELSQRDLELADRFSLARRWRELGYVRKAFDCLKLSANEFESAVEQDPELEKDRRLYCKLLLDLGRPSVARTVNEKGLRITKTDQFERELTEAEIRVASFWLDDLEDQLDKASSLLESPMIGEENRSDFAMLKLEQFGALQDLREAILEFEDRAGQWHRSRLKIALANHLFESGEAVQGVTLLQEVLNKFATMAPNHPIVMSVLISAEQFQVQDIDFVQWWENHRDEVSLGHARGLELFTTAVKWRREPVEDYRTIRPWLPELKYSEQPLLKIAALRSVWRGALVEGDAEGAELIAAILLQSIEKIQDTDSLEYAECLIIVGTLQKAFANSKVEKLGSRFEEINRIVDGAIDENGDTLSVSYLKAIDRSSPSSLFSVPAGLQTQTAAGWIRAYLNHCGNPNEDQLEMVAWYSENHAHFNPVEVLKLATAAEELRGKGGWGEKGATNWKRVADAKGKCAENEK